MIQFTINGKEVGAEGIEAEYARAAVEGIEKEMIRRVSEVLSPAEMEKIRVFLVGDYPDSLAVRIEGDEALAERARARLRPDPES